VNPASFAINDNIREVQAEKIKLLKERRDPAKVEECLKNILSNATNGQNLMPVVIDAVENYCTLGEISDTLRSVFGEYS